MSALAAPLGALTSAILDALAAAEGVGKDLEQDGDPEDDDAPNVVAAKVYALKLALSVMRVISQEGGTTDVPLAIRCIEQAPDAQVRAAALAVIADVAAVLPDAVLSNIVSIGAAISSATTLAADDVRSQRALQDAMTAIAPLWLSRDGGANDLLQAFVSALPSTPEYRRAPLLGTLLRALPTGEGLRGLLSLLVVHEAVGEWSEEETPWPIVLCDQLCEAEGPALSVEAVAKLLSESPISAGALKRGVAEFAAHHLTAPAFLRTAGQEVALERLQMAYARLAEGAITMLQVELGADDNSVHGVAQALLEVLGGLLTQQRYLHVLARLFAHTSDTISRRALRLFAMRLLDEEQGADAVDQDQVAELCAALLPAVAETVSLAKRQSALIALESLARNCTLTSAEPLAMSLPNVVLAIANEGDHAVRASAMLALAALTRVLVHRLIPHLPTAVPAVIEATTSVLTPRSASAEEEELVRAAGLTTITALLEELGAYISPHIPAVLKIALAPAVLEGETTSASAATLRKMLPAKVPPRLLLEPLTSVWETALAAGGAAAVGHLGIVEDLAASLDKAAAAAHHERVFGFLLKALDVRREPPEAISDCDAVEGAAVSALAALTLQIPESAFKPMFSQMLEWAQARGSGETGPAAIARPIALFRVVNALAEKLRGVFVPYFKFLAEPAVSCLKDAGAALGAVAATPSKRAKKAPKKVAGQDPAAAFRLRAETVAALHKCFLYDTVGFLDQPRFEQLLTPLIEQLEREPPAGVDEASVVAADSTLVECLTQMASTAADDGLWRPLNRAVLMCSRSARPHTRLLSVRVTASLVDRLQEEYLVLLPETIPFVSELLEDTDEAVEAATRDLLAKLTDVSGEDVKSLMQGEA